MCIYVIYIWKYTLHVCLGVCIYVCLYSIHVKTAELIKPNIKFKQKNRRKVEKYLNGNFLNSKLKIKDETKISGFLA